AQHMNQRMAQATGVSILATGLGVAGGATKNQWLAALGMGTQVGGSVYLLSFSRDNELEADALGVRYMTRLGYNPRAQIQVMQILQKAAGSGGGPEFLATHPHPETRIKTLEESIAKKYPDAKISTKYVFNEEQFQANVLSELAKLPKPKHTGQESAAAPAPG